ncbi:cupin domain-containing protein [Leeia sp. TBRC 13508]|uniref:Cupin domain-containing protein n=1 Tax=Leeia speluncae TaxID=2884804 RepID=A0ABS8D9M5_9NEIS|nr:cupin domain-containing protein [Leeia speluncae]MCB6184817.1 cupin domain-containing protein [Leeia speluncae]
MCKVCAVPSQQINNDRTVVTEWKFAAGAETGWHTHEMDYVVVPMTDGVLMLEVDGETKTSALVKGQSYFRKAGVRHNVTNTSDHEVSFIEIEIR